MGFGQKYVDLIGIDLPSLDTFINCSILALLQIIAILNCFY